VTITDLDIQIVWRMIDEDTYSLVYDRETISGYLTDYDEDKNYVASLIWGEKAASMLATTYDISADGADYKYSQKIENAKELARYYSSKRKATTPLLVKNPVEVDDSEEL
jgi:hypothetical protein